MHFKISSLFVKWICSSFAACNVITSAVCIFWFLPFDCQWKRASVTEDSGQYDRHGNTGKVASDIFMLFVSLTSWKLYQMKTYNYIFKRVLCCIIMFVRFLPLVIMIVHNKPITQKYCYLWILAIYAIILTFTLCTCWQVIISLHIIF